MKIDDLIDQQLQNPEFAQAYQAAGEQVESALALFKAREAVGLTQVELAQKAGVSQSTIARIERGDNVTFKKLATLAHAMDKSFQIEFV
ncbi:helix-turn-helix domain-containing protein [Limosilactobacillus ingluviei]|uniref:helix-turn-helix domain-containing protein n=1 Tax=Limosilactobacillus ingluviei TaxID=148604 RepID=UPI0023F177F7|nr:helix-turn-helix transcriptional regulator [Limosilactobacillus ingluviei]